MLRSRQWAAPATMPVTTLARLTDVETAPGLMPVLSKTLDDVGPKPMPECAVDHRGEEASQHDDDQVAHGAEILPEYWYSRASRTTERRQLARPAS